MTALANATAPRKKTAKQSMLVLKSRIYAWYDPNKKPDDPCGDLKPIADKNMPAFEAYHKLTEALVASKGWFINASHVYERWQAVGSTYMHSASCSYLVDDDILNITLELALTTAQLKPKELTLDYRWRTRRKNEELSIPIKLLTEESCEQTMARIDAIVDRILGRALSVKGDTERKQLLFKPEIFNVKHIKHTFLSHRCVAAKNIKVIALAGNIDPMVVYASYLVRGRKGVISFALKDYSYYDDNEEVDTEVGVYDLILKRYSFLSSFKGNSYHVRLTGSPYFKESNKSV